MLAALLPRSEREERLLGKTGRRLTGAAREAAQKGLDAGKSQIEEIRAKAAQKVGEAVATPSRRGQRQVLSAACAASRLSPRRPPS